MFTIQSAVLTLTRLVRVASASLTCTSTDPRIPDAPAGWYVCQADRQAGRPDGKADGEFGHGSAHS